MFTFILSFEFLDATSMFHEFWKTVIPIECQFILVYFWNKFLLKHVCQMQLSENTYRRSHRIHQPHFLLCGTAQLVLIIFFINITLQILEFKYIFGAMESDKSQPPLFTWTCHSSYWGHLCTVPYPGGNMDTTFTKRFVNNWNSTL